MQSGAGKNPPWARSNVNTNMTGMNSQMMDANSMMSQQGMMPFQQTQAVFNKNFMQPQGALGMAMGGQMPMNQMAQGQMYPGNVVAYPTPRGMNPGIYQNAQANTNQSNTEQRVFTGTVTQAHNDIGFVDNDVFYQTSVCAKGIIPKVNDRVLVEATYNPNMPFKWNATRVQVLPKSGNMNNNKNNPKSNSYNAAPPPMNNKKSQPSRRDDRPMRRDDRKRSRTRSRSRSRDRQNSRSRRDSPPRKRPVMHQPSPPKYLVRVPRMPLDIQNLDVPTLSQRYTNLYVPSDFFSAQVKWGETFPPQAPFSLNNPCTYHIMNKDIPNPLENDAVLEPPDADYRFSAKVMLISMPTLESLYQKCGLTKVDEKEKRSSSKSPQHPTRLIKFLVGQKGKGGENFAIGGPWSPSLDGEHPDTDPGVLVKTAIRTCKALTGVDLSACTQWYRMVEFYYWREGSGGKSRMETVVLFLPDVWSAQLSRVDWPGVLERYKAACDAAVKKLDAPPPAPATEKSKIDKEQESDALNESGNVTMNETITIDENDDDVDKPEPTHHSKLDLKTIKVDQLRQELRARNASCKGNKAQLLSRLSKILKTEAENKDEAIEVEDGDKEEVAEKTTAELVEVKDDKDDKPEVETKPAEEKKVKTEKEIEEEKKKLEKEKQFLKTHYDIPSSPHIVVHPSTTAKGGKFNCTVATLSLLLDYRISDNKEHSFELFVFAELFNEMLMRDFGFYIYKTLYTLPEKAEEPKESKDKQEKDGEKKDEKDEGDKNDKEDKKDDKKNDKRDSRKRKEDPHSDDDRSSSPRRRSRGVELPIDPYLLLSLVYFDTARGGTINKKDLQNLFMSLGLQLSRSQIRSILEKVCIRDNFSYRALMQSIKDLASGVVEAIQDMPLDSSIVNEVPSHIAELETVIATGNRNLLPVFNKPTGEESLKIETKDVSDTGVVMYKSRVIDLAALVSAEARNAAYRQRMDTTLESLRKQLQAAKAAAASTQQAERGAQSQLSDVSNSLQAAKARIASLTASSKIFHAALKTIQAKVEAVVNIKYEDDDVVEVVNGPTKVEKKEAKKEEPPKEEPPQSEQNDNNVKTDMKEESTPVEQEKSDNNATENMELSDKE